ncbi:MAG: SDR family NAD(P)-dependent oxidoreductase [Pirellulales bacterium]
MTPTFWTEKRIFISGASSGLGREFARVVAPQRAHLILLGRDQDRLEAVGHEARSLGAASVRWIQSDAFSEGLREKIEQVMGKEEGIDLLVHAIGKSDRGYLHQLQTSDLEELFRINVLTAHAVDVHCMPYVKRVQGCIVHVGSLASKVATAGMGGYAIAKHGLAAYSQQLRREVASDGVHVMLVCPGPIARQDSGHRYDALAEGRQLDEKLRKPGGGAPIRALDPKELCANILAKASRRELEWVTSSKVRWLVALAALWPRMAEWLLKKSSR